MQKKGWQSEMGRTSERDIKRKKKEVVTRGEWEKETEYITQQENKSNGEGSIGRMR